jgi:methionyl-tRNA synthetase
MMKVVDRMLEWENAGGFNLLKVGYSLRPPELLFRKIEDEEIEAELAQLKSNLNAKKTTMDNITPAAGPTEVKDKGLKPEIVFDDFGKIDLRVGTIIDAHKVEKADKLLQLEVDLGTEKRTILSGIAMHFDPAAIVGKQVVVVANLAPRKMRGIESKGMILMAEDANGKLYFVQPSEAIAPGSSIS